MDCIKLKHSLSAVCPNECVDPQKCIICQKDKAKSPISGEQGRKRILEVASISQDIVSKRLRTVDKESFVYHSGNECYEAYTHEKHVNKSQSVTEEHNAEINRLMRSRTQPRDDANLSDTSVCHKVCVICGQQKIKNVGFVKQTGQINVYKPHCTFWMKSTQEHVI